MTPKDKIKTLLRSLLPSKPEAPVEKQTLEEQKEILELAVLYDRLVKEPGWEKALKVAAQEVNSEIVEATRFKYEPDRQRTNVIRWDAKRELLDNLTGYIEGILKSRDEIILQLRGEKDGNAGNAGSGVEAGERERHQSPYV